MNLRYLADVAQHTQRKDRVFTKATVKKPAVGATLVAKSISGAIDWATKVAPTFNWFS